MIELKKIGMLILAGLLFTSSYSSWANSDSGDGWQIVDVVQDESIVNKETGENDVC